MAYDPQLADRVQALLADNPLVHERLMFGGLAFLVAGRVAVAASALGGPLVRVGPTHTEQLLRTTAAQPMETNGRIVRGWLHVDGEHLQSRLQLEEWAIVGTAAATTGLDKTT